MELLYFSAKHYLGKMSIKDHVHILVSAPPNMAPSEIMRRIKGNTASRLFEEFPHLKKRYWGATFLGTGIFLRHLLGTAQTVFGQTLEYSVFSLITGVYTAKVLSALCNDRRNTMQTTSDTQARWTVSVRKETAIALRVGLLMGCATYQSWWMICRLWMFHQ